MGRGSSKIGKGSSKIGSGGGSGGGLQSVADKINANKGLPVMEQVSNLGNVSQLIDSNTNIGDIIEMPNGTFTKTANGQWISNKGFTFSNDEVARIVLSSNSIGNSIKFRR